MKDTTGNDVFICACAGVVALLGQPIMFSCLSSSSPAPKPVFLIYKTQHALLYFNTLISSPSWEMSPPPSGISEDSLALLALNIPVTHFYCAFSPQRSSPLPQALYPLHWGRCKSAIYHCFILTQLIEIHEMQIANFKR